MVDSERALFQDTITVVHDNQNYEFKIPNNRLLAQWGIVARNLRRRDDPEGDGSEIGLSPMTLEQYNALAAFELLLVKTSADWVYSADASGKRVIDSSRWPYNAPVLEVYSLMNNELIRFLAPGTGDSNPNSQAPVADEQPDGATAVRSE